MVRQGATAEVDPVWRGGLRSSESIDEGLLSQVASVDPGLVVLMLGTNDAFSNANAATKFETYQASVSDILTQVTSLNSEVVVLSVLPFDLEKNQAFHGFTLQAGAPERIATWYNPWLMATAETFGVEYLDLHSAIPKVPDWQERLMAPHDGLHLSTAGAKWVSEQVFAATERPCDINGDSTCGVEDLDQVLTAIGREGQNGLKLYTDMQYDFDWSGDVDLNDRDAWLSLAGTQRMGTAYLLGDVSFDSSVDPADLNRMGLNWMKSDGVSYGDGNLNGDSSIQASDLNLIAKNWIRSANSQRLPVPEPSNVTVLTVALIFIVFRRS